jgi:hypothetical protein
MSQRIFVNSQNERFKKVTQTSAVPLRGLGIPTELSDDERLELGQKAFEIYFSADDLREKQRKIRILFDSFTDPKFFGDGAVKLDKVQKYITDLQLEAERAQANSNLTNTAAAAGVVAAGVQGGLALTAGLTFTAPVAVSGLAAVGGIANFLLPYAGVISGIVAIANILKSNAQVAREDNAAPWKMTRPDFPNITSQAIAGSSSRRSIERLYDDRSGVPQQDIRTEEAIARLVREALADALFCTTSSPNGITSPEHPGPRNNNALKNYFPFKEERTGTDRLERTYVNALIYLKNYIDLIDSILNLQNESLSRSPDVDQALINIPLRISLSTANVQLFDALSATARQVVREKVLTFFDENREYKTLLNFGDDRQYVAEAWRIAPKDTGSVQLKLTRPLDTDISLETPAFISREIAETVVDIVNFQLGPLGDTTPYLRPYNIDARNYVNGKMFSSNTTLTTLGLATGSEGTRVNSTTISIEDDVFRRWFTGDFKASELNIDFTDYNNFVHFGSAYKRLQAFNEKLIKIDDLTSASKYDSASVSSSTISNIFKLQERENIIRNFDAYEQFLYYATESVPYSASAFYVTSEVEYNPIGSWPKQNDGTPYSPYSTTAINWLTTQTGIAQRYDDNNPNYLVLNLPKHIQEDADSTDFLTLFEMVGHLVDNIKVYIDQFPNIYSTNINPLEDLSMDQVYEVAQSFGLKLPNVYALENLQTFNAQFSGESGSRSYVAETWKRFLHSMVYFNKTKGSRTSFDALLSTYGINSPVLQIKETTHPSSENYIRSDELTYGLNFTGSATNYVTVPFVSGSLTASSVQLSFNPVARRSSSLLTTDNWAIDLVPHPSSSKLDYGRIHVVSGSTRTIIATSSYFPLFTDDYTNIMLRSQSYDISIIQTDGDQILFQESASVSKFSGSLWNGEQFMYVGGSGSMKLGNNFDGVVDEVRVWGENISNDDFVSQAYDPGSYYGATYTSSYTSLYVHVPFSQPLSSITSSVTNESPYQSVSIVATLPAVGFTTASFTRVLRGIKQFTPIVGSSIYTNKKVVVADPPVFNQQFVDQNGTKVLSRLTSIKAIEEKQYNSGLNVVSFAVSPTDFINQNIIRSMGVVDVNNIIGSPRYITGSGYSTLQSIQKDYIEYFNKTVQPNDYIRFFKDLTQGPSEMADEMAPARAKLFDGIVIESPVLSRNKDTTVRSIKVDGSDTKAFIAYVSGSGSSWNSITPVGAYDFSVQRTKIDTTGSMTSDTLPIEATISISSSVDMKESTKSSELPTFRRVLQKIGDDFVTSSILDPNSSYATIESIIVSDVSASTISAGYPRNPFVGIPASQSIIPRLVGEENTLTPFYDIPPRSDFSDVGSFSYFHKRSGVYSYDIYTLYKTPYVTKLDTTLDIPSTRLYAPITLVTSGSIQVEEYGRNTTFIPTASYAIGQQYSGVLNVAGLFTLYGINGETGLRLRLYADPAKQGIDSGRDFYTLPTGSHGVLFDGLLSGASDVFPYVMMQAIDTTKIYYTIDNISASQITSSVILTYFAYEPDNLLPNGYLPRHYKFSRDNNTALKRRNYLGCRDTNITFDGQAPFSVSISTKNTVVVNTQTAPAPAGTGIVQIPSLNNNIRFGGGGRLGVEG